MAYITNCPEVSTNYRIATNSADVVTSYTTEDQIKQLEQDIKRLGISSDDSMHQIEETEASKNSDASLPLKNNPSLDAIYKSQLIRTRKRIYKYIEARKKLPAYNKKDDIIKLIADNRVVVITGETGCGKSTQIPQYILDDYIENENGSLCRVICTQPRKISTIAVAERVARERGEHCGKNQSIGYQIRLDSNLPRCSGSILYCTSGIMIKYLHTDPQLSSYSHVILDEVHERNLETDFLIILLKDLLKQRTDLRLILMSATMKAELFSEYFDNCPVMEIPGMTYPVEKYMLEDVLEMTKFIPTDYSHTPGIQTFLEEMNDKYSAATINSVSHWNETGINFQLVISLLKYICKNEDEGAILVFLPGWDAISDLHGRLDRDHTFSDSDYLIIVLHSLVPVEDQHKVFDPAPHGIRKIILATNIAETSITIDDVVFVIDCGKMKMNTFDGKKNISSLDSCWISKANGLQRRGRAGRVKPGKCYHLFTGYRESKMPDFHLPEIVRTNLANICLMIKHLKLGDIGELLSKAMDRPSDILVSTSISLLQSLNALDEDQNITLFGSVLAQLPVDPRLGKMLLYGVTFSCLDPILTIAAVLDYKDPFFVPKKMQTEGDAAKVSLAEGCQSDHIMFAKAFSEWNKSDSKKKFCKENFLSISTLKMIKKLRLQLVNELYSLGFLLKNDPEDPSVNKNSKNTVLIKGSICAGLYPNIAVIEKRHRSNLICFTTEDGQVSVHPKSIQRLSPHFYDKLLVYYNKLKTTKIFLHDTTVISPSILLIFSGKSLDATPSAVKNSVYCDDWLTAERVGKQLFELMEKIIGRKIRLNWNKIDPWICCLNKAIDVIRSVTTE